MKMSDFAQAYSLENSLGILTPFLSFFHTNVTRAKTLLPSSFFLLRTACVFTDFHLEKQEASTHRAAVRSENQK